ncbi:hypothetical protein INT46_005367 [Mucor plumbeus]|uniref:Galactose oxidase n=1 Tax=Mucor plumbeus TaxID=97098 RepID=A0A8H7R5S2_9FUNG|nr:hypothetical protein INT46_005367 [Mucor plumbeus]
MKSTDLKRPLLLLSFIAVKAALAQQTVARSDANCGLLSKNIYCFGGIPVGDNTNSDSTINMLDLTICNGETAAEIQKKWMTVSSDTNGVNIQARYRPQAIALPDGNGFLISGGYSSTSTSIVDQTIVYNASTNKWSKYQNFEDGSYGNRQIYYGSSVNVPSLGVGFYGGMEEFINPSWTIGTGQNISKATFNGVSRTIGYPKMTFFNLNASTPWNVPSPQNGFPTTYSVHQTSIYDPVSRNIFFFGGEYHNIDDPNYLTFSPLERSFAYSIFYNIDTSTWGNQSWGGTIPSTREFHTTTLLPSTNEDILLFGGEKDGKAVPDYCYILNLNTKQWVQKNIDAPAGTALIRTKHSDVLVDNSTLFIVFGKNSLSVSTSSVLMLNITDPSGKVSLYDTYTKLHAYDDNTGSPRDEAVLSTGAIAGIAVGSVIAVSAFKEHHTEHIDEPVEVDWDQLENKYVEMPSSKFNNSYPPSTNFNDEGTTLRGTEDTPIVSTTANFITVPDGSEIHKLNTAEAISQKQQPVMVLKPDGSGFH